MTKESLYQWLNYTIENYDYAIVSGHEIEDIFKPVTNHPLSNAINMLCGLPVEALKRNLSDFCSANNFNHELMLNRYQYIFRRKNDNLN